MKDTLQKTIDQAADQLGQPVGENGLSIVFNNVAVKLKDSDHAAVNFAKANNIPEILGNYKFAKGVTNTLLQDFAVCAMFLSQAGGLSSQEYKKLLHKVWSQMCDLNPVLNNINLHVPKNSPYYKVKHYKPVYHAIMGASAQFNVDDINHFLQKSHLPEDQIFQSLKDRIEQRWGKMYWRPSPKTLNTVHKKLGKR